MDQVKIGGFLRKLRGEKGLTQEQLAEQLAVSNRSVSRWENGVNMPDFDLLMQIARYYDVSVGEILDGERSGKTIDSKAEDTLQKVADYGNQDKLNYTKRIRFMYIAALAALTVCFLIDLLELRDTWIYAYIADFMLGLVFGMTLVGLLYTTRFMARCREFKMRLLKRNG